MGINYRALGDLTVVDESGQEHPMSGRPAAVLALLLAVTPETVSSERIIEEVWGDSPPRSAEPALHTVVSRLRAIVGADLVTAAGGYRIDTADLDITAFEASVEAGDHDGAATLWRGEPFRGFDDSPTVRLEADRLRLLHARSRLAGLTQLLDDGLAAEAAAELAPIVKADPFNEEALGIYMRALNSSGRKPAALAAYGQYRNQLAEETGLEPSSAIQELELAILVDELDPPPPQSQKPARLDMSIEYVTRRDGERIAVGRTGTGPPLLVHPGWLSKLDVLAAGSDFRAPFFKQLADSFELTMFDRFGTGLSRASEPGDLLFETSVDELIDVIRATSEGPVPVWAASGAGPIAIEAAARHPELISHLILYCTFADGPGTFPEAVTRSMTSLIRSSWGMGSDVLASLIFPGGSAEMRSGMAEFQKASASPEVAAELLEQLYRADASGALEALTMPCLVIHYEGDKAVPVKAGQMLARSIPGARYLPLDGVTHYPLSADFDRVVREIEAFIAS